MEKPKNLTRRKKDLKQHRGQQFLVLVHKSVFCYISTENVTTFRKNSSIFISGQRFLRTRRLSQSRKNIQRQDVWIKTSTGTDYLVSSHVRRFLRDRGAGDGQSSKRSDNLANGERDGNRFPRYITAVVRALEMAMGEVVRQTGRR